VSGVPTEKECVPIRSFLGRGRAARAGAHPWYLSERANAGSLPSEYCFPAPDRVASSGAAEHGFGRDETRDSLGDVSGKCLKIRVSKQGQVAYPSRQV
jgi:hypothetical protein